MCILRVGVCMCVCRKCLARMASHMRAFEGDACNIKPTASALSPARTPPLPGCLSSTTPPSTVCSQPNSGVWRRHCPTLSGRRLSAHDDAPEIDYFKPPCTRPPTPTGSTSCTDSLGTDRAAKCSRFSDFSGRLFESERRPRVCVCVCVCGILSCLLSQSA